MEHKGLIVLRATLKERVRHYLPIFPLAVGPALQEILKADGSLPLNIALVS